MNEGRREEPPEEGEIEYIVMDGRGLEQEDQMGKRRKERCKGWGIQVITKGHLRGYTEF